MENNIVDLVKLLTVVFGALTALFIAFKNWINFSEYFKYKKINHFSKLLEQVKNNADLQKSVEKANNEAVFQSLTGYPASSKMIEATCKLFNEGNLSLGKIKSCYRFFKLTKQDLLKIEFRKSDKWLAAFSGIMVFLGTVYFLLLAFIALYKVKLNTFQGFALTITIVIIFLLYLATIGGDLRNYLIAKNVK